jgi:hypothetical protein
MWQQGGQVANLSKKKQKKTAKPDRLSSVSPLPDRYTLMYLTRDNFHLEGGAKYLPNEDPVAWPQ